MKNYDYIYLTNTPSFYKLNLCGEIAKTRKLLVVFAGYDDKAVNKILQGGENLNFDVHFLNQGDYENRNRWMVSWRLVRLLMAVKLRKILYSGWMTMEYNLLSFFIPRNKNVLICESSDNDTNFNGLKGWVKRRIVGRMSAVLPSGIPHARLFTENGFKGRINITGSVGIFNKGTRQLKKRKPTEKLKYLYVGRLVDVKNIELLIGTFNRNGKTLTIVGDGILREKLTSMAQPNITFLGFKDNDSLGEIYQSHDVFILPSYSETWGLVVEEALYWGLPVIVSDRVGCSIDMVKELGTGAIFRSNNADSLNQAIEDVEQNYDQFLASVNAVDWEERDRNQVKAYTSLLDD